MNIPEWREPLSEAYEQAVAFLESLPGRRVGSAASLADLRAALGGDVPEQPSDPRTVVASLAAASEPGLLPTVSGRFFGFVIGGSTPTALAADWLTAAWDQNAGLYAVAPAAAVAEETAARWILELLGLPDRAGVGFVTGCQMAHVTCLAAARNEVLRRAGWDVEAAGLIGAPRVAVVAGAERHVTVDRALRFLGLGTQSVASIGVDDQGRLRPAELKAVLAGQTGPVIVCAQAGNINTGAFDPLDEVCDIAHAAGAWVHVDGAFGLWAAASAKLRHLLAGVERADSWATDAHKWLNVPYDSGLAIVAEPATMHAAMGTHASYLVHSAGDERDAMLYNPEFSRRARGFPVYAALREHGRAGLSELVDRTCALARRFAELLAEQPGTEILNDVVLNQVLVRFGDDETTRAVIDLVQRDGTCWVGGTTWQGRTAMRLSVCNWSTDDNDIDLSARAIARCAAQAQGRAGS